MCSRACKKVIFILDNPQLEYTVLNPNGPFVRLNPFNKLRSGETQTLVLSFSPRENVLVSAAPRLEWAMLLPWDHCHISGPWRDQGDGGGDTTVLRPR